MRRTKIVATVGPVSGNEETLTSMVEAGVNVFRINSSHGSSDDRVELMKLVRSIRDRMQRPVGLLVDLQGPRIRVGSLREPRVLEEGASVTFAPEDDAKDADIPTTYEVLAQDVRAGDRILLDDGMLEVVVDSIKGSRVRGTVEHGGTLRSHKGLNLPGVRVSAPAVTAKDRGDIELAAKHGADFIGLSFVGRAEEIWAARGLIPSGIRIVSKIERATALDDLDRIVEATDSVMVARGDLGVELLFEEVPLAQKRVIQMANRSGRPVVTATQMLESMIHNPRPTRAEASDVANAVLDGTDAVMLSAETAIGEYPVESVRAMARIIEQVEGAASGQSARRRKSDRRFADDKPSVADAIAVATCTAADMLELPLIVCFTSSGFTARQLAAARPRANIIAVTPEPRTYHQLALSWGAASILTEHQPDYERMLDVSREALTAAGFARSGDQVAVTAGVPFDMPGTTNLLKIEVV
jgi:pyruvate kinase